MVGAGYILVPPPLWDVPKSMPPIALVYSIMDSIPPAVEGDGLVLQDHSPVPVGGR